VSPAQRLALTAALSALLAAGAVYGLVPSSPACPDAPTDTAMEE
jgi:hypothetical protein